MWGLREQVERLELRQRIGPIAQGAEVARQRRGVAGDVDDAFGSGVDERAAHSRCQPRSRGVEDHRAGLPASDAPKDPLDGSRDDLDAAGEPARAEVRGEVLGGAGVRLDREDARKLPGQPAGEEPRSAVELRGAFPLACGPQDRFAHGLEEAAVGLREDAW